MSSRIKVLGLIGCLMIFLCGISSCGITRKVSVKEETVYKYIDSLVVTYRDSLIEVEVPKEVIKDVVPQYDTLLMETSVAKSISYVDTMTHTLKGSLENKTENTLTKIVYLPSEEHIVYRDSIVTKEVPVEVEVTKTKYPKSYWWLLTFFLGTIAVIGLKLFAKCKIS